MIKYRFYIGLNDLTNPTEVHPVYKDDLALDYAREGGEMFMRATLSSTIDFIGADYTLITTAAFDTEFIFDMDISADGGVTWSDYYTGYFYMTDCTINVDDKKVTVKPEPRDKYKDILNGLEKEYDLISLAPVIQPVTVQRRPVLQVYALGDQILTNILSEMSWEQDCNVIDSSGRMRDLHFGKIGGREEITLDTQETGLTSIFVGDWSHGDEAGEWTDFSNGQGVYTMKYFQDVEWLGTDQYKYTNGLRLYRNSDNVLCWEFSQYATRVNPDLRTYRDIPASFTFTAKESGLSNIDASWFGVELWGRLVMASDTYQGNDAYEIPSDDIIEVNRNYRYCYPFPYQAITMSGDYSATPTEWGMRSDGNYFVKPAVTLTNLDYIPVARSLWVNASTWYNVTQVTIQAEAYGRKDTVINDTFSLDGCIAALLSQVEPNVTFQATSAYSEFLFGTNPLFNGWGRLFVTPKSNVLVAEYTQPARKAMCTLKDFLDMLRKCCGLYWFIDSNNRFRLEHISWFKNGGSYSGTHAVGIDLTTMINPRNGKPWSFATSKYNYDKLEMSQRYQTGWMDDSTIPFAGEAIEIISKYCQNGDVEEDTVGQFNSDIDYIMLNPYNVSPDGFCLIHGTYSGGVWHTDIDNAALSPNKMQNWQVAFCSLQPAFLISDMPAWSIKVNGITTTAKGIQRKKTQQVSIPVGASDPNMMQLVRTAIGDGEITKMSIRLTSRMAKTTLVYDTTQQ